MTIPRPEHAHGTSHPKGLSVDKEYSTGPVDDPPRMSTPAQPNGLHLPKLERVRHWRPITARFMSRNGLNLRQAYN